VPGHEDIEGSETADQLARTESECPLTGPEPACCISSVIAKKVGRNWTNRLQKILVVLNRNQISKGIPTRTICQKDQGTLKTKQRPVAVGDRTTNGTLSPERTPVQNGIDG
jgi:hypothetical protein